MRSDVRPEMRPDMRSDTRPSRQERYQKEQFEPQRGNVIRRGGNTPPPRQTRANLSAQNTKGISPSGNPPVVAASAPRQPESLSAIFSPNIPPSLAALEQEYLYLSDAVAGTDVLRTSREEQALMRFVGSDALTGKIPVVVAKDSPLIVPAKERLESSMEAHSAGSSEENADGKPAPRPLRRPQQDEPEDARSPFGDIIATMQEVLIARNSGRYIPLPKATERPRPPGVELHPAIGFKLYAPNPHRPQHPQQSSKNKHHRHNKSRPEKVYPAAVPLHDVFATMPPATADFHERLQKTLHYEAELPEGAELLVAVSGGVDSIALLDMLVCLSKKQGYYVAVVHFNHRLRGQESEYDANFVRETCKRYDIPCYIAWADVGRFAEVQSMSLEQAGRELRYKFLEFVAYKRRSDAVLTAHTLNDSVETMLMNMLRGSGLTGLSGIPFQRVFGEHTKVVRPALNMKKAELQEYAALRGLSWREDETNSQTVFRRNKIRNELVPLLEREYSSGVVDVLHRTSQIIMGADDLVRETVERVLPSLVVEEELQPFIGLNISVLRVHKRFLQTELVRRTVQRRFGLALSFEAVDRVLALMDADVGAKADITKGFMAVRDRNQILLGSAPAVHNLNVRVEKNNHYDFGGWRIFLEEIDRKNVKFTADPAVEFIETRILPYRMTLRTWQPGDVFTPLGMKGTMKVSDYLTNSKISFFNRQNVLVLTAAMPEGEQIVWLCGLRLSEQFRLQTDAPKALRLEFRRPKGIVLAPPPQEKG
jgi:tRNA(Ile)-lysidine synthase